MENVKVVHNKASRLFIFLGGFFIANALVAEFIGVKIFSLERTLGIAPIKLNIFGTEQTFDLTAGVLLWPFVFILTDVINEYYGRRGVRLLSFLAAGLISYSFLMFYMGIHTAPAEWWPQSHIGSQLSAEQQEAIRSKVSDYNFAYRLVFGQGLWIIIGSLTAFLIGQLVDVTVFHRVKRLTGEKSIWLRATGSTLVSQFIDSFVVLLIAFYIGAEWDLRLVLAIGVKNYIYKFVMAIVLTPLIYLLHEIVERYLGPSLAAELKKYALETS
ncbi:MAG TPA: queuosine precursor transporter [Chitinophagales bacterium]|nr:queuosine precursor transporter [Chitinophagales bacterium]